MPYPHFTGDQLLPFWPALGFVLAALGFHNRGKFNMAIASLSIAALLLGLFMAGLDPFLNLWDEQYHALVAKHMTSAPFTPMLYDKPLLPYDPADWTSNHIWLHKQPLFLWQMALSIKIFGSNEIAVRLPSVLMHALMAPMLYRLGSIAFTKSAGFYAALLLTTAYFPLELVAGTYPTDHNDLAFLFYTTAGVWAWFEYQQSRKPLWLLLIGLFAGGAVLVKWFVGLLIFAVWPISECFPNAMRKPEPRRLFGSDFILPYFKSLFVALLVFLPWQLYIFYNFPLEAAHEYRLNLAHFSGVVESHAGEWWFHFKAIRQLYGSGFLVPALLIAALVAIVRQSRTSGYAIGLLAAILIPYVFYSLASTKMIAFTLISAPYLILGLGVLIHQAFALLQKKLAAGALLTPAKSAVFNFTKIAFLLLLCFFMLRPSKIQNYHTEAKPHDNRNRIFDMAQMEWNDLCKKELTKKKTVVFNSDLRLYGHISTMYYTGHIAYPGWPDVGDVEKLKADGWHIALRDDGSVPSFLRIDTAIVKINFSTPIPAQKH